MIYFAQLETGAIKIGFTKRLESRIDRHESHYASPVALLATMPGGRAKEREIHRRFAHLRFGQSEQFRPGPDLMEFIGKPLLVSADPELVESKRPAEVFVTVKGSPEWREWVNRGARYCRTEVAKVVDAALVDYFKARGFTEEAPER